MFRRPQKRKHGRRMTRPILLCLQRHPESADCGPRVRQFFDAPRQATLSQIAEIVRTWLPDSVKAVEFYAVRNPDPENPTACREAASLANTSRKLERLDPRNRFEDIAYYFGNGVEGEVTVTYGSARP